MQAYDNAFRCYRIRSGLFATVTIAKDLLF